MKGVRKIRGGYGFTIIEVVIFLGVSGAILLSAIALVNGQQGRTEFTQAINQVEAELQQVPNDVLNGYYISSNTFSCTTTPGTSSNGVITTLGKINITSGAQTGGQGSNQGCVFIGKAVQFGVKSGQNQNYNEYAIVGSQCFNGAVCTNLATTNLSSTLESALPTALKSTDATHFDGTTSTTLQNGLNVGASATSMQAVVSGATINIGTFGFLQTLGAGSNGNGAQSVNLYAIAGTSTNNEAENSTVASLDNYLNWDQASSVSICFSSATNQQSGQITIGGTNRQISVTLKIFGDLNCQ